MNRGKRSTATYFSSDDSQNTDHSANSSIEYNEAAGQDSIFLKIDVNY